MTDDDRGYEDGSDGTGGLRKVQRALGFTALALVALVAAGTALGLATGTRGKAAARKAAVEAGVPAGQAVYLGIGTVRSRTKDDPPAVVVATVSFPYDASDREFREELFGKRDALRKACVDFFAAKTADGLHPAFLGQVKASLAEALNAVLALGKIDAIYVGDYAVIK